MCSLLAIHCHLVTMGVLASVRDNTHQARPNVKAGDVPENFISLALDRDRHRPAHAVWAAGRFGDRKLIPAVSRAESAKTSYRATARQARPLATPRVVSVATRAKQNASMKKSWSLRH